MTFAAFMAVLPDLIKLILYLIQGVEFTVEFIDGKLKLSKFDKAIQKAKNGKDTSELEAIFNPKPASKSGTPPKP